MINRLRNAVVDVALAELERGVLDIQPGQPDDRDRIDQYYREVGGHWASVEYTEAPGQSWCGIFVAWCALHVGEALEPNMCVDAAMKTLVARKVMPSTYRLQSHDKWHEARVVPAETISPDKITRGDIVVVGHDKPYGDHITLALGGLEDGAVMTVSGNVTDDKGVEGVRKKLYHRDDIAVVYRLGLEHFKGAWTKRDA